MAGEYVAAQLGVEAMYALGPSQPILVQIGVEVLMPILPHVSQAGGHRYWRLHPLVSQGGARVGAHTIVFYDAAGTRLKGELSSSAPWDPTTVAFGADDQDLSTYWLASDGPTASWWQIDAGAGGSFLPATLALGNSPNLPESFAKFEVQYSDDGATWATYYTSATLPAWTAGETRTYNIAPAVAVSGRRRPMICG